MNETLLTVLKKHIQQILKFVESPSDTNIYKYHNLVTDEKTEFKDLKGFPCEFFLFLSNKNLCRKYKKDDQVYTDKSCLDYDLDNFLRNCALSWDGFTGDYAHPIPNRPYVDLSVYNAGLVHQHRKAEGSLWLKDMGTMRISYLKHILFCIDTTLDVGG